MLEDGNTVSVMSDPAASQSNPQGETATEDPKRPGFLHRRLGSKSVWDWFLNIFIPLLIGTIGFGLWLAHQQQQSDQQLALDQEHAAILQTYIGDMNDLLRQGLSASTPGDEIRQVATAQTVTTLRSLDANHNGILLQFLQDAHLIGSRDAVINLSGAELSGADLAGANLSGASLTGADLTGASLSGAILTNAILSDAILVGADLSGARLGGTILSTASLSGADLSGADLSGADLNGADITQAQLDEVRSCADAILSTGLICQQRPLIQLTYWYTESPAETPVILNLINQFNRQNPGIHINAVQRSYFQARAAFTAAAHDGNAPDVFRSDIDWTTLFASKGYLLNIDQYVSQRDLSDYLNAPLSTTRGIGPGLSAPLAYDEYKGDLYGLPQVTDFLALLYNKKELAKAGITGPPSTMADFEADGVKVVQKEAAKYGFETGGNFYYALPFLYASGGGMFDQHNNILVNNAGSVKGLNFLLNLENDQVMPPKGRMLNDFMNGTTAMIFDGPYDVKYILSGSSFNKDLGNLGIAGIPTGPSGQTGSPIGGQSYVISAGTAYPAQAYQFIKFMSSTASQVAIASVNHTLPTRQSAYRGWVSSDPVIKAFLSIKDTVVARPAIAQDAYLLDSADPSIWAALTGAQCADDALNAVAYSWNQLGAGNLVSQSTFTPGASPTACA